MLEVFKTYWEVLLDARKKALMLIFLSGLAGALEGVALITLIPLLKGAFSISQGQSLGWDLPAVLSFLEGDSTSLVRFALGLFLVLGLLSAAVKYVADSSVLRLRAQIEEDLRVRMTNALLGMEWSAFLTLRLGDIIKSMSAEGHQVAYGASSFIQGVGALLVSIVFFFLALTVSMKTTLTALVFILLAAMGYRFIWKRVGSHAKSLSPCATSIGEQISDIFNNLKFFRATGLVPQAAERANRSYRNYTENYVQCHVHGSMMRLFFEISGVLMIVLYLWVSILVNEQSFAECFVFLALFYRLAPRVLTVNSNIFEARAQSSWFVTWKARFDQAQSCQQGATGSKNPTFEGSLVFQNVTYTYPSADAPALRDLTLSLRRNECLAIVGESGSGKSTIVDLLTGLLVPQHGQVSLGGVAFPDIDTNAWRSGIGLVLQETPLFNATVLENISFGETSADLDRARHCAKLANASGFIERLPEGYQTLLGEKGGRLSGGERQRIALARALYRNPWLLVLDEATSALDGESEARIQEALEGLKGQFSMVMIAHRLKTVQMADKIIVLKAGEIVECGTWDELVGDPAGTFFHMAQRQGLQEGSL